MTIRQMHTVASSIIILGIAAGAVSWLLAGTIFWIDVGISAALVLAGLVLAGRIPKPEPKNQGPKR